MKIPFYQVDAFTDKVFGGNPAAVCLLDQWPADKVLQSIAAENNLSETAFLVGSGADYALRWFTPTLEIDLCGHATLASAFVIFNFLGQDLAAVRFQTASGQLQVERAGDLLVMDFPARKAEKGGPVAGLEDALGAQPAEVYGARDILAVLETEAAVRKMTPDFAALEKIKDAFAVIVTAPGDKVDFVSRFFAPNAGIPEDPVTGSAHCTLVPYWSARLGKKKLHALQVSARGGELFCEDRGDRVLMAGNAVLFARGELIF
ncbi:MAG: PhzF family phenazine biosynthesis protein [Desulfobacterales bacterium]|nr:PhzF family phenazine biosynthesis protein [Desulfobacterales bacterium]